MFKLNLPFHCFVALTLTFAAFTCASDVRAEAAIVKVDVFPAEVELNTARDRQSLVVMATREDGVTLDVTTQAQWKVADPAMVKLDGAVAYPVADGATTIDIELPGHAASVPVVVKEAAADRPISFRLDVMPVFMRTGCNTGSCHGAARGKDGFRLSLFALRSSVFALRKCLVLIPRGIITG